MEDNNEIQENKANKKIKNSSATEIKEDFKLKIEINKWEQKTNKETSFLGFL